VTIGAGDADNVPVKTLAGNHGVDLDDVLCNKRIGGALLHGAVVPNWTQAHVACLLQVIKIIIIILKETMLMSCRMLPYEAPL
jgi:hypothetical protein